MTAAVHDWLSADDGRIRHWTAWDRMVAAALASLGFFLPFSSAGIASAISFRSSTFLIGWFCSSEWKIATPSGASGLWKRREISSPFAFQWETASVLLSICICPTISSKRR